ncbi:hypothetical protein BC828DRAFT_414469 [Blastocladiella britannica]|nr:hypothetical protein BC828DRAFT_414469 [Blastocladiella britannica]
MTLLSSIAGWSTFGVAARAFANAIERKHPLSGAAGHAGAATIFGAFGYWVYNLQESQKKSLEKTMVAIRDRKRAQLEAAAAAELEQ